MKISNMGEGDIEVTDDDEGAENIKEPSAARQPKTDEETKDVEVKPEELPKEEEKKLLPDAPKKESPRKEEDGAKIVSLEKPSGDEMPHEIPEENSATEPKKSFFSKARDFVVNKFKGN